jgi:murein DD-endopeptidase MepM/ murein hydrolase activator NlpD
MKTLKRISIVTLCMIFVIASLVCPAAAEETEPTPKKFIKWMTFTVPYEALVKAKDIDIQSHDDTLKINWVDLLAYLGAKYGGNWKKFCEKDMTALVEKLKSGQSMTELTKELKYYNFFHETYDAVLSNFIGDYQIEVPDGNGGKRLENQFGLKVFSPIAKGYGYSHYDDFGDSRSFGFRRRHTGNDLLGSVGTPIIAVEGGVVEAFGWNRYGGWRIGIRSFNKKRSYYYAHLRKNRPYAKDLKQGQIVKAGDVIGYLGMTGYSYKENANNMT